MKHTRRAIEGIGSTNKGTPKKEAIAGALGIFFGRFVDYMSVLCLWEPRNGEVKHTFARYALPITWDFVEANPLTISNRFYAGGIEVASRAINSLLKACEHTDKYPTVRCESSLKSNISGQQLIFTDPPYYDAIPYSDLMDFFFIWQKRILGDLNDEFHTVYDRITAPKWNEKEQDGELIDDESRFGGDKKASRKAYEDGMAKAFQNCCRGLDDEGRLVVVFANKEVDAWETLISALIRGGATVTASWPIQTEMPNKVTQKRANLSSSVWIVCRKRPKTASKGWDANVLEQMKKTLFDPRETLGGRNILQYFFDLGIRGPDFMWAALGPALESYSAHPFVKKTEGGVMSVKDFLREVRKLVLQFSLGELPGFRDVQKETRGRGEAIELDPVTQYYLLHRAYFGIKPAPAGACILYANACGKNETELKLVWNIIEQGGQSKRGRPTRAESEGADVESEGAKGNEYRLLDCGRNV